MIEQIFGRCSGRFRTVVGQEVSDVRGVTLSKRAKRHLTEILLLLLLAMYSSQSFLIAQHLTVQTINKQMLVYFAFLSTIKNYFHFG